MNVNGSDATETSPPNTGRVTFPAVSKTHQDVRFASRSLTPILNESSDPFDSSQGGRHHLPVLNPLCSAAIAPTTDSRRAEGQHQQILEDVNRALQLKHRHTHVQDASKNGPSKSLPPSASPMNSLDQSSFDSRLLESGSGRRRAVSMVVRRPTTFDWSGHSHLSSSSYVPPKKSRAISLIGRAKLASTSPKPRRSGIANYEIQKLKSILPHDAVESAKAVANELSRRYALIFSHLAVGASPLNFLAVIRHGAARPNSSVRHSPSRGASSYESPPCLIRLQNTWSLNSEGIESFCALTREAITSPIASSLDLSTSHISLVAESDLIKPRRTSGLRLPIPSDEAFDGQISFLEGDSVVDSTRTHKWRFSASSLSSREQSPRESLHNLLSLTRASTGEDQAIAELPVSVGDSFVNQSKPNVVNRNFTQHFGGFDSTGSLDSFSPRRAPSSVPTSHRNGRGDNWSLETSRVSAIRRAWNSDGPNVVTSNSNFERELLERERIAYQHRARLLLHSKQANDRTSRTLSSLSNQLMLYGSLQMNEHSTTSTTPQLLDALKLAAEDYTLRTMQVKHKHQEGPWNYFSRQQQAIVNGTNVLRSHASCSPLQMHLRSKSEALNSRLMDACADYDGPKLRLNDIISCLHRVESFQADAHRTFQMAYLATTREYTEMQNVTWMAERYTPLKTKIVDALWNYGGPLIDFIGTNFAAPMLKSYGRRYIWPDLRDFVVIPYFKSDYEGGDPREFRLKFPQRSVTHWIITLFVVFTLLATAKLLWDAASLVEWIATYSLSRQQHKLTMWFSWMMFRGATLLFIIGALSVAVAGFSIVAALLWWLTWYLTLSQPGDSRPFLVGWSAVGSLLVASFVSYVLWVVITPPLWK